MFQGFSIINNGNHSIRFLKELVTKQSYEWRIDMPQKDFLQLPEGDLKDPEAVIKIQDEHILADTKSKEPSRTILSTRLYLDADLVSEMAKGHISNEIFIERYPELLADHWEEINTDLLSFKNYLTLVKGTGFIITLITVMVNPGMEVLIPMISGTLWSLVFPKSFSKAVVFVTKRLMKFG